MPARGAFSFLEQDPECPYYTGAAEQQKMPATFTKGCRECGEQHVLFIANEDIPGGLDSSGDETQYEYTCPKNRATVRLDGNELGYVKANAKTRPRGAVDLRRV